ncbi:MAG: polyprenyl synthetase family protein, partial [Niallia sp.]
PLIYAMKANPSAFRPLLEKKDSLTEEDMVTISELIDQYQGVECAMKLAKRYTHKAIKEIGKLPEGAYRDTLLELTKSLL